MQPDQLQRLYSPTTDAPVVRRVADLCDGPELLTKLREAIEKKERIVVYGDYDADGIMATYILCAGLNRLLPGRIRWFINNRFEDGYSITVDSIKKCLDRFPQTSVLITCDNGINAAEAIDYAMEQGVTVLVTDHHVQTVELREDCPAVDEKSMRQTEQDLADGVEAEAFCGAELARRVIAELYEEVGQADRHRAFLDSLYAFSGFATITDLVPMNASNHALGRSALQIIRRDEGFWRLLREEVFADDRKRGTIREIHGDTIAFYYGPLMNSGGRMTGVATLAMRALFAFNAGDEAACRASIRELVVLNEQRKELSEHDDRIARELIETNGYAEDPFILLCDARFSEGVNGLTAAHITERYRVPCAVLSPERNDPSVFKGSARSVEGCNLVELLTSHGDLIRAGGHAMAAGLSIKGEDVEQVRDILRRDLKGFVAPPEPVPDFVFQTEDISMELVEQQRRLIDELEPFGPGFEAPRLEFLVETYALWPKKKKNSDEMIHASFPLKASADRYQVGANWWKHLEDAKNWFERAEVVGRDYDRYGNLREWRKLRFLGSIERNEYMNRYGQQNVSIQLTVDRPTAEEEPNTYG